MTPSSHLPLAAHLYRHARRLHGIACGLGRQRDADDIIQTLYARWCRRLRDEPGWAPPETSAELYVCVRRVILDLVAKEKRERDRHDRSASASPSSADSPEDALHAFERLEWILARLPAPLAEALTASLSAGRSRDALVAHELGLSESAYTMRLYKARRAAEELASYYELLSPEQASLLATVGYSGKSRRQIAHELGLLPDELAVRAARARDALARNRRAAAS
ncbi:MAG: hypothetical protein IT373_05225 [Polyangiaceae bacterium]|nr:hypothetical protein [Polyangiaceae bacterium]